MPDKLDGIALYKEIQKRKPRTEKRIIFTTGDTASKETHEFLENIDNFCLEKPFLINDFIDTLNRCLNEQKAQKQED